MNNEWYTPGYIIESARSAMGSIDLDPASCEEAQQTVKARDYYDINDSGLEGVWGGNVWLNPPYSRGLCSAFVDKFIYEKSNIDNCIILVNSATSTKWFHKLIDNCEMMCLFNKRIKFIAPGGMVSESPKYDQVAFFYARTSIGLFRSEFQKHGTVVIF